MSCNYGMLTLVLKGWLMRNDDFFATQDLIFCTMDDQEISPGWKLIRLE